MKAVIQSLAFVGLLATATLGASAAHAGLAAPGAETIASYRNRFARDKPVIAVIAENSGTELTDFVVPYGVLAQSGVADVFAVATQDGAITMRPALHLRAFAAVMVTNGWFHSTQQIGVPLSAGMDEIALALTADAYSRTGRSQAVSMAASDAPVVTRNGLVVLPDRIEHGSDPVDRMLAARGTLPSARALDVALAGIASLYGRNTAYGVALDFEYPGFRR